jgi:putative transposase
MKRCGQPQIIATDKLRSYGAAMKVIGNVERQNTGRWLNNRAENFHLPFRRRGLAMLRFRRARSLQKFVVVHASVYNFFNHERSLSCRDACKINHIAVLAMWRCSGVTSGAALLCLVRLVRIRLTGPFQRMAALGSVALTIRFFDIEIQFQFATVES